MESDAPGPVSYLEIGSKNSTVTRDFFARVFGWRVHDEAWFQTPTIKVGLHGDDPTPQIYVYFGVADLEATAKRIVEAGGDAGEVTNEPGFGRFCNCRDPQGIRFGLHQNSSD